MGSQFVCVIISIFIILILYKPEESINKPSFPHSVLRDLRDALRAEVLVMHVLRDVL